MRASPIGFLRRKRTASRTHGTALAKVRQALTGYLFVGPVLVLFLVYWVYAIGRSLYLSVTDYKMLESTHQFVGLRNYATAIKDQWVISGFGRAAYFTALFYVGAFLIPLILALLIDRVSNPRLNALYRTLLFLPAVMPEPLVYRLWRWMYMPSYGLLNYTLVDRLHLLKERPLWLVGPGLEMPSIALMAWWQAVGFSTVFFVAALDQIQPELYEAARIDGARELQIIWRITLPLLRNTLAVWTVLRIGAFGVVSPMMSMWDTEAPQSIWTWAYYAWFMGFRSGKMPLGYASAIGWLGAIVMVTLALGARRLFRRSE